MSVWSIYESRVNARGDTKRKASLRREIRLLGNKMKDNLSFEGVTINGKYQEVTITSSGATNKKNMMSLPQEDIEHGGIVKWKESIWLVTEKDVSDEVYTRTSIVQCNHLLKWIDDKGVIREQWCVVEDAAKSATGEKEGKNSIITIGSSRVILLIPKNKHTVKLGRGCRFFIDDSDSVDKLAYVLTKPIKIGEIYNGGGVYSFVLDETASTNDDNMEAGVADYYKYFPKKAGVVSNTGKSDEIDPDSTTTSGKKVWL